MNNIITKENLTKIHNKLIEKDIISINDGDFYGVFKETIIKCCIYFGKDIKIDGWSCKFKSINFNNKDYITTSTNKVITGVAFSDYVGFGFIINDEKDYKNTLSTCLISKDEWDKVLNTCLIYIDNGKKENIS